MTDKLDLPPSVRQRASSNGAAGRRWLAEIDGVVGSIAELWGLQIGATLDGGTAAFVAAATDGGGHDCVLKIAMPLDGVEVARSDAAFSCTSWLPAAAAPNFSRIIHRPRRCYWNAMVPTSTTSHSPPSK